MATPVLTNGIFLREERIPVDSRVDEFSLRNLVGASSPTDLGVVEYWALARKVQSPLYNLAMFDNKNTIIVDDIEGRYTWKVATEYELPVIVDDVEPTNTTKGILGTKFKLKFNKKAFSHGDIISADKMYGQECVVTEDDIISQGDSYIYTVRLINGDSNSFLNPEYVKRNTRWFRKGSFTNEYGQRFSSAHLEVGFRQFYNFVGGHQVHAEYRVDEKSALVNKWGLSSDGKHMDVFSVWSIKDEQILSDPSVKSLNDVRRKYGDSYIKNGIKKGTIGVGFVTKLEAYLLNRMLTDIETYLMWGKGGRVTLESGPKESRLSVGLWYQTNNGYKRIYTRNTFNLSLFREAIYNFFAGREDFDDVSGLPQKEFLVFTGMGGATLFNEAVKKEIGSQALFAFRGDEGGAKVIDGDRMNLRYGYFFSSVIIPFIGTVKIVVNPAFDNVHVNTVENPIMPEGFNLSSYSFVIFDITDNAKNNIYLLRSKYEQNVIAYSNGTMDYMGRNVFQSNGRFSGFEVFMKKTAPAIWIKDPTKVMKIVMRNPITGGSL